MGIIRLRCLKHHNFRISGVEIGKDSATFTPFKNKKVVLNFDPFWIEVYDKDDLLMAVNSNGLLKFEHFRNQGTEKDQDGEGFWEEKFNSFTDTKPFGSSAISLDVEFFGFKYLYGLPEHATSLALRSTLNHQLDPYRIFNVDIFEYELNSPMSLYGGSPLVIAHNKYRTVGAYWFNVADTWVDIHSSGQDKVSIYITYDNCSSFRVFLLLSLTNSSLLLTPIVPELIS